MSTPRSTAVIAKKLDRDLESVSQQECASLGPSKAPFVFTPDTKTNVPGYVLVESGITNNVVRYESTEDHLNRLYNSYS